MCRQSRSFKSSGEGLLEGGDGVGQPGFSFLVQSLALLDLVEQSSVAGLEELVQTVLERQNLFHFERTELCPTRLATFSPSPI